MRKGVVIWITGLPCSGKTTIAEELMKLLKENYIQSFHLDGDNVREGLTSDLGFSKEDRKQNLKRVTWVAEKMASLGVFVVCSFVSPYEEQRKLVKTQIIAADIHFLEVFVNTPVTVCTRRDVKGMWKKAIDGEITGFTGYDDPYEKPKHPDLELKTTSRVQDSPYNNSCSIYNDMIFKGMIK